MAELNPLIPLKALEAGSNFRPVRQFLDATQDQAAREQSSLRAEQIANLRSQIATRETEARTAAKQARDMRRLEGITFSSLNALRSLESDPTGAALERETISRIQAQESDPNVDNTESKQFLGLIQEGRRTGDFSQVKNTALQVLDVARARGIKFDAAGVAGQTAGQREFADLTKDFSKEDELSARRISLGLDPRAVGSAVQTITEQAIAAEVAETERVVAGGKELGKLEAQLNLKPDVEKAVKLAIGEAVEAVEINKTNRSNAVALNLYNVGMRGLAGALGGTTTGPIVGLFPALTVNQQVADGAVAALAPILKQMFRAAGEGIFTDKDQELLLQLIPTRRTSPEAVASILWHVDAVVQAKLAPQSAAPAQVPKGNIQVDF